MTKKVTFAELEKLLLELGFVRQIVQGAHLVFQYPALGTLVVLPGLELIAQQVLQKVRLHR